VRYQDIADTFDVRTLLTLRGHALEGAAKDEPEAGVRG
jgi:hypothetical protein